MRISSVIIIVFFLLLYIVPLGMRPMLIPDEFRYAEISREMLVRGDWVVPHLDGLRYFEKPVLGYWLNAIAISMFGENAFAVRFFSAIAVGISSLFLFFLVRKYAGGYRKAIFIAVVFLTCSEVFAVGTFSVLDSIFSMFLTAAIILFFFASMEDLAFKRVCFLVFAGISCGLAFLTKGFLAFAVPAVTIIPFLIWQRRAKEMFRILWIPVVTATLVALPWCLMIYVRERNFWHYFFWTEHILRFVSPKGGQHPEPFWFFVPFILGGAFPWTFLLSSVVSGLRDTRFRISSYPDSGEKRAFTELQARTLKDPLMRYTICWFLFPFLLFSAASGKLGTYILPCFPPCAIIISVGLLKYFEAGKKREFTFAVYTLLVIVVALMLLLILSQTIPTTFRLYEQQETWKAALLAIAFLLYALFLLCAGRAANFEKKLLYFAVGPAVFMFCAQFVMPNQLGEGKAPGEFLRYNKHRVHPDTTLVSDNYLASAVCWCYQRSDVFILDRGGELTYGLGYDDSKQRLLDIDQFRELITKGSVKGYITLITSTKRYAEYQQLLPEPVFEDINSGFVFAEFIPFHQE